MEMDVYTFYSVFVQVIAAGAILFSSILLIFFLFLWFEGNQTSNKEALVRSYSSPQRHM